MQVCRWPCWKLDPMDQPNVLMKSIVLVLTQWLYCWATFPPSIYPTSKICFDSGCPFPPLHFPTSFPSWFTACRSREGKWKHCKVLWWSLWRLCDLRWVEKGKAIHSWAPAIHQDVLKVTVGLLVQSNIFSTPSHELISVAIVEVM